MGRDYPDWGGQYTSGAFFPLFDMAELAARLGSIFTHDRRGNLIWQTSFDNGLSAVTTQTNGAGSLVSIVTTPTDTGNFACKLTAPAVAAGFAQISKTTSLPVSSRYGFSARLIGPDQGGPFTFHTQINRGTTQYAGAVRATGVVPTTVALLMPAGYTDIFTTDFDFPSTLGYEFFKLVVDVETGKYVRLITAFGEWDLSAYSLSQTAVSAGYSATFTIKLSAPAAVGQSAYIDDMIVTANEPENQ